MQSLNKLSNSLGQKLTEKSLIATTAESCTGGGVATAITDIAGSSAWFDRAFVTYSNEAKMEMLGVRSDVLDSHGAVSEPVVEAMALGAVHNSNANLSVAISGIAGPGGATETKPVGTVCFAWALGDSVVKVETCLFSGDRAEVRHQAVQHALQGLINCMD